MECARFIKNPEFGLVVVDRCLLELGDGSDFGGISDFAFSKDFGKPVA